MNQPTNVGKMKMKTTYVLSKETKLKMSSAYGHLSPKVRKQITDAWSGIVGSPANDIEEKLSESFLDSISDD